MKILVAVKPVPDPDGRIGVTPEGRLDTSLARPVVNPYDEIALDHAYRLCESGAATEVVAVTVVRTGEEAVGEEILRAALARAADRAVLVVDDIHELRPEGVGVRLADIVRQEAPDLVLFGRQGADSEDGQTGPRVAGVLGWPFITAASEIALTDGEVRVIRETDAGRETLEAALPAVVTCDLRGRDPRPIPLFDIVRANDKPLDSITVAPLPATAVTTRVFEYRPVCRQRVCRRAARIEDLIEAIDVLSGTGEIAGQPLTGIPDRVEGIGACHYVGADEDRDTLAWIAGRWGRALVTGVTDVWDEVRYTRAVHAGRFLQIVGAVPSQDCLLTVRGRGRTEAQKANTDDLLRSVAIPTFKRIAFEPYSSGRPDLGTARIVVAGGRALRDAVTFERVVGGLADALGGAVAASGGAVHTGIALMPLLVGVTGRTIAPDLYIALGISGADQHTAGFTNAKRVVAINSDPEAAIFKSADIGLVADVVPAVEAWMARLEG